MKLFLLTAIFYLSTFATSLPSLQHAKIYKDQNISGWVMSEKLDGIRGYWDGKAMFTKSGKELFPPKDFTQNFPPFALDGELWSKRQDFENIQSKVLKHNSNWSAISYNIFEVPHAIGDFFVRMQKAKTWFIKHPNPNLHIIPQRICEDTQSLNDFLDEVVTKGGEGVMVKNPYVDYISGRTSAILKVKKAQDMEGEVIAVNYRKDNKTMKSVSLQIGNGMHFNLGNGFSDEQRTEPPAIGSLITFKYYGFTKYNKPKFASFVRTRLQE